MVLFEDLTVVVQGPVDGEQTAYCLKSIRKCLPGSRVILSTWIGSDLSGIELLCDEVVLSEDIGAVVQRGSNDGSKLKNRYSNINRQIRSTLGGLNRVESKYVLKIRTDVALENSNFLKYFGLYEDYDAKYKYVQQRILLWNLYTRNPHIRHQYPDHYSDVVMFGLRDDMLNVWDIPFCSADDNIIIGDYLCARYFPEQYLWLSFLRKYNNVNCPQYDTKCKEIKKISECYLVNNVVLLNSKQYGLEVLKKSILSHCPWTCYSHADWRSLYNKQNSGKTSGSYIWLKLKGCYFLLSPVVFVWR